MLSYDLLPWYKNHENQEYTSNYKSYDEGREYPPPGDVDDSKEFEDEEDDEN